MDRDIQPSSCIENSKILCQEFNHQHARVIQGVHLLLATRTPVAYQELLIKIFAWCTRQNVCEYNYTLTTPCCDYSSPCSIGSTSTVSCATTTWPHRFYCTYAVHPDAPSRHSTSHRSVALALAVRPVTASRGATTRRPDCTDSTAPMSCIRTRRLATRLLVGRSHWLSPCVRSLHLAARLLVVLIAPALLRLCRASVRAISPLDFLSVGRAGSRRVPGHSVVRRDYLSRGRNGYTSTPPRIWVPRHVAWLVTRLVALLVVDYFDYAARPGASARRAARR
jgi:hypothetical protein